MELGNAQSLSSHTIDSAVLCNQCGIEEIHHDNHLLVRMTMKNEFMRETSGSIEQQLVAFKERTENTFERMTQGNGEALKSMREEMNMGLKTIREEVQYRLERIERLLVGRTGCTEE